MLGLRALTEERGILLIADEIQTGMGRTGKMFACGYTGITPDIMTLGKGIGGGVPLAAMLAREAVCCFEHGDQGGTFNGNPLMTAAGLAVWTELSKPGFLEAVVAAGRYLTQALNKLPAKHGFGQVRGRGLLLALDLRSPVAGEIAAAALDNGLILNAPRPDTLHFVPALNVSHEEMDQMLEIFDSVIRLCNDSGPPGTSLKSLVGRGQLYQLSHHVLAVGGEGADLAGPAACLDGFGPGRTVEDAGAFHFIDGDVMGQALAGDRMFLAPHAQGRRRGLQARDGDDAVDLQQGGDMFFVIDFVKQILLVGLDIHADHEGIGGVEWHL